MKEKLYDMSEAVAALNRVEGFNPMELARTLTKEGQEDQLYLDVKYRKLWFRLVYPLGKIVSSIRSFTENMAIVEARIYLDKCDEQENYIANAFSQKFRTNDPNFGDKFLEMAETAAVGRALSDAGFGLQFADVGEADDPMQVDAGIPIPKMTGQAPAQGNYTAQKELPWNPDMQPAMTGNATMQPVAPNGGQGSQSMTQGTVGLQSSAPAQSNMMNQFYQQAQEKGAAIGQNPSGMSRLQNGFGGPNQQTDPNQQANQNRQRNQIPHVQGTSQAPGQYSPAASLDESLPVEELVQRMTYEQATQIMITGNGKFGGKTMGQVAVESPDSLGWFAQSYSGTNHLIPAAARVLLNAAMPMAG
ncbi:hypothetical protein AALD74_11970 [Lachnospiraceae bacterium 48-21]